LWNYEPAVEKLDHVTPSHAASAKESDAAAQELNAQAEMMKQAVGDPFTKNHAGWSWARNHMGNPDSRVLMKNSNSALRIMTDNITECNCRAKCLTHSCSR
jgi:hypothetical protein